MKSSPEITLTTTVDGETRKVQAAESFDEISRPTATGLPATGELRTGVTTTSSSEHGPSGCASGGGDLVLGGFVPAGERVGGRVRG
jgi:hypothetical protein